MRTRLRPLPLAVASAVVLAVGIGAWSPASQADTTPAACTAVGPNLTDFTAVLTLPKFDPALGTLTGVTISGSTTMRAQIRVENTSATADTVSAAVAPSTVLLAVRDPSTSPTATPRPCRPSMESLTTPAPASTPVRSRERDHADSVSGPGVASFVGPRDFRSTYIGGNSGRWMGTR